MVDSGSVPESATSLRRARRVSVYVCVCPLTVVHMRVLACWRSAAAAAEGRELKAAGAARRPSPPLLSLAPTLLPPSSSPVRRSSR